FVHIAEHFSLKLVSQKATHSVFVAALRNRAALEKMIIKTVKGPSRKLISRATVDGVKAGRPIIILERQFAEVIGETLVKDAAGKVTRAVVKDAAGKVI